MVNKKIEDRLKYLEITKDITRGKLKKMFDKSEEIEIGIMEQGEEVLQLNDKIKELTARVDVEIDKLIALESLMEQLKIQAHCHRVIA